MSQEGFGIRLGAAVIDGVILQLCVAPFLIVVVKNLLMGFLFALLIPCTDGHSMADADEAMSRVAVALDAALLVALCYSLAEIFLAGTPGKLLLGLRIRNQAGHPAQRSQLAKRWSIKFSWLLFYGVATVLIFNLKQPSPLGTVALWVARVDALLIGFAFLQSTRPHALATYDSMSGTAVYRMKPSNPERQDAETGIDAN